MAGELSFSEALPFAWSGPALSAVFKQLPEDFVVTEHLGFELAGQGEHVYLWIEKKACNTSELVQALADFADIDRKNIGYAGLKDKQSVSFQWLSVYLPKTSPSWQQFQHAGCTIHKISRHNKKLRSGEHAGNGFQIRLREVCGDRSVFRQQFEQICRQGFPNYFGEQRFGRERANLYDFQSALPQLLQGQKKNGKRRVKQQGFRQRMQVAAARAWLFNTVLAERVRQVSWHSNSSDGDDACGPLWGRGRLPVGEQQAALERSLCEPFADWQVFFEHCGLQQERRKLRAHWQEATYREEGEDLVLQFQLPAGSYATSALRELFDWNT